MKRNRAGMLTVLAVAGQPRPPASAATPSGVKLMPSA